MVVLMELLLELILQAEMMKRQQLVWNQGKQKELMMEDLQAEMWVQPQGKQVGLEWSLDKLTAAVELAAAVVDTGSAVDPELKKNWTPLTALTSVWIFHQSHSQLELSVLAPEDQIPYFAQDLNY